MAAEPNKSQNQPAAQGLTRQKKLAVLVPIGGVAVIAVLVAIIVGVSDPVTSKPGEKTMPADGSNGGLDDSQLITLTGGLKYRDLKVGDGPEVPPNANVTIHYVGWLPDGTVFDSSRERGQPADFPLASLIQGWQLGIPGMKVGGIRKLVVPPELGYGAQSRPKIPGGSTLIFEVEVLGIGG